MPQTAIVADTVAKVAKTLGEGKDAVSSTIASDPATEKVRMAKWRYTVLAVPHSNSISSCSVTYVVVDRRTTS